MDNSAIQPARMWVDEVHITANPEFRSSARRAIIAPLSLQVSLIRVRDADVPLAAQCDVHMALRPNAAEEALPYLGEFTGRALFVGIAGKSEDYPAFKHMVATNGLAMVYGLVRDGVLAITALGMHGPFILPALNLLDLAQQLIDAPDEEVDSAGPHEHGVPQSITTAER